MNKASPGKKLPPVNTSGSGTATTNKPTTPSSTGAGTRTGMQNGYVPKYTAPAEPIAPAAPNVENRIELPSRLEIVTLDDLCRRIYDNASILLPGQPIKLTTARSGSGLLYHALVLVQRNPERESSRWRVEVRGPPVGVRKGDEGRGRREAVEALLWELEGRVGKELLA